MRSDNEEWKNIQTLAKYPFKWGLSMINLVENSGR